MFLHKQPRVQVHITPPPLLIVTPTLHQAIAFILHMSHLYHLAQNSRLIIPLECQSFQCSEVKNYDIGNSELAVQRWLGNTTVVNFNNFLYQLWFTLYQGTSIITLLVGNAVTVISIFMAVFSSVNADCRYRRSLPTQLPLRCEKSCRSIHTVSFTLLTLSVIANYQHSSWSSFCSPRPLCKRNPI